MIADGNEEGRRRLASAVGTMRGVSLGICASDLSETYHAAESRPPQAVLVAENLARLPEFEVMQTLFRALNIRCILVADTPVSAERLAARAGTSGLRMTHQGASQDELRQCLFEVLLDRPAVAPREPVAERMAFQSGRLILIGASTGGVDALIRVLSGFPADCPPTLVVQHTSGTFSAGLARLLDRASPARVLEAEDRQPLVPGTVLLAPGKDHHLEIARGNGSHCRLREGPPVSGHRPSVDALFHSAVPVAARVSAAILTGMGRDGAEGMLALRRAGAHTIGQDQASALVYGMPRAAHELGAVCEQLPIGRIGQALLKSCARRSAA
ncbi:CheB methylesterase domain-containing protein [Rhodovulum tesquicola]|uniref:CheB methylesterase domain-containing protein n=1 Tax=Rhodovulum tesquicola TaxID=540254 RepID=UPI0020985861|nr:CheB methylesterase domain-containing protein [Rhodovulum tesquicola]MCO8144115.1 CheB methylesterase domain-containing protein [Rhodovulum tesquicola]